MFEMLLFHLGSASSHEKRETFGINVFKVREILVMPEITKIVNAHQDVLGVANIRGQLIPVIDLCHIVGSAPAAGHGILLVTEFSRSTQAFAIEEVNEIVRVDWNQVLPPEGKGGGMVTGIAKLNGNTEGGRLVQVLDVEQIVRNVLPGRCDPEEELAPQRPVAIRPGAIVLAADDSTVARMLTQQCLDALHIPCVVLNNGKDAWERLQTLYAEAQAAGLDLRDKVALVLTDLEMPEMDGIALTQKIKQDVRFQGLPVIVHSSLAGIATEQQAKKAGADAYLEKFVAKELGQSILKVLESKR
jgi:two-component system chemotaxis response regulator CheV